MITHCNHIPQDWNKDSLAFRNWMIKINNIYYCDIE